MKKNAAQSIATAADRYLAFSLGEEDYAVPLLSVKEVIAVPDVTPVPFSPPHLLGIINLRGQIISVMDLRKKFGMPIPAENEETALIIMDLDHVFLGIVVDAVNEVVSLGKNEISDTPDMLDVRAGAFLAGVARKNSKLILLLEVVKTLEIEDLTAINRGQKSEAS